MSDSPSAAELPWDSQPVPATGTQPGLQATAGERPASFADLAASRRSWIEQVLRPWCRHMPLQELRRAEQEWFDIAGRADTAATLWTWAWERFPVLVHPDLPGVHETHCVTITLTDGTQYSGYPDARQSQRGVLVLIDYQSGQMQTCGPFQIDQIRQVNLAGA